MAKNKEPSKMGISQRYALTGAAIGLYFALFAKPTGVPDFGIAVILSVLAAIVTVAVQSLKKQRTFLDILKDFFGMLLLYGAFMGSMQLRKLASDQGGQLAVSVITVAIGVVTGLFFAARAKTTGIE
jgi:hypothetical protein